MELKICLHKGCKNNLRPTNLCGFCREHYRESKITKQKEKTYRHKNKKYKRKYDKKYRDKNKKKISKDKKEYRKKNIKRIKDKDKNYYKVNKNTRLKKQKLYYIKNKAAILLYQKHYRDKNREIINKKAKDYYNKRKNKKRRKEYQKWYLQTKHGKGIFAKGQRKRRAHQKNINEIYSEEMAVATYLAFDNACFNCNKTKDLCIDHFCPLSLGFPLSLYNSIILCRQCNSKKHNKMPEEFFSKERIVSAKKLMKDANKIYKK